jgi:transcriptional regulator with XRE-family HTH domain
VRPRRRATGLRREELAALAGISVDYLTRLEQGRATAPSAQVVEALARALRLPDAARDLLYQLAGHAAPGPGIVPCRLTPSVQRLLDRLAYTPLVVYDAMWTLVMANAPYDALMGVTSAWRGIERNAIWRNLLGPASRVVHTTQEQADHEARLVADLRLTASRYPADRALRQLVSDLAAQSPRFAELWNSNTPPPQPDTSKRKTIDHPAVGRITLDCDTLIVALDDLRMTVYTAEPGTDDAERLALALVLGTQALVD